MKISIPEEWVFGRWWQNRILWLFWLLGAIALIVRWVQSRGSLRTYVVTYLIGSTAAAIGFAMGDWTNRRRDAARRYRLPGEK